MERHREALLLVLAILLLVEAATGLPAQTAALKRKKKKKGGSGELRLLNESQPTGSGGNGGGSDYLQLALRRYLNNQELTDWLQGYEKRCKSIARLTKIGSSAQDRPLWALEISDRPGQAEAEPAIKYVGGVHGDEPTGRVLTLALAEWLCANYKTDARAKRIVSTLHLWLLPAMNPDGFDVRSRGNSAGKDLNRDFPDRFSATPMQPSGSEQPETQAVMDWTLSTGFVASASMHEGALVANYPWDGTEDRSTRYEACPDDAVFRHLATLYASTHKRMALPDNSEFPNGGTTNGANWYPIYGSMQDWNYIVGNCLELTLELSPNKWPRESGLVKLWEDNRDALLAFPLTAAYGGVWGSVQAEGKLRSKGAELVALGGANITVMGISTVTVSRKKFGDFYRPLAPGRYTILVSKEGYKPIAANLTIPEDGSGAQRHFLLTREDSSSSGAVGYSLRALGQPAESGGSDGVLPWKASRGGRHGSANDVAPIVSAVSAASRVRDRSLMLGAGAATIYGLVVTHRRLQRRSHRRMF